MKTKRITQTDIENNPTILNQNDLGKWKDFNFVNTPKVWNGVIGYLYADTHLADGFKELITPTFNAEIEKLGDRLENDTNVTFEVIALTDEELDARVPLSMPRFDFKMKVLKTFGITNAHVDGVINAISDENQKAQVQLMWYESKNIYRNDPILLQFAGAFGITENDIKNLFK